VSKILTREEIEKIDAIVTPPDVRAAAVWRQIQTQLPTLVTYDLLCFCIEYAAYMSTA
jgi:hypothetical protein